MLNRYVMQVDNGFIRQEDIRSKSDSRVDSLGYSTVYWLIGRGVAKEHKL